MAASRCSVFPPPSCHLVDPWYLPFSRAGHENKHGIASMFRCGVVLLLPVLRLFFAEFPRGSELPYVCLQFTAGFSVCLRSGFMNSTDRLAGKLSVFPHAKTNARRGGGGDNSRPLPMGEMR